jgi:flagellar biosynthesis protein FlhB
VSDTPHLPPTARRRALARAAGMVPLSRPLVAAAAWIGAVAALVWTGGAAARALALLARADVRAAAAAVDPVARAGAVGPGALRAALLVAAPMVLAAAAIALVAHLAQTRSLWLPRRRVPGAPTPRSGAGRRVLDAAVALTAASAVAAIAGRAVWNHGDDLVRAGASARGLDVVAAAIAQLAAALLVAAVADWLVRVLCHAADLRMTAGERRADERAAGADPRWHRYRRDREREGSVAAIATAAVVLSDDRAAAAVRWHARWHPVPRIVVGGVERAAISLVAAARRAGVPVQHDADLAQALAQLPAGAPVPTVWHDRLARHLAAVTSPGRD